MRQYSETAFKMFDKEPLNNHAPALPSFRRTPESSVI
jgi:hypothetical protein